MNILFSSLDLVKHMIGWLRISCVTQFHGNNFSCFTDPFFWIIPVFVGLFRMNSFDFYFGGRGGIFFRSNKIFVLIEE